MNVKNNRYTVFYYAVIVIDLKDSKITLEVRTNGEEIIVGK